jgi:DNA-binding HxlR family transcriptional regulator
MDEQSEFEFNPHDEIPLARAGDPITSHLAAQKLVESGKWRGLKGLVLAWMREHQIDDSTSMTSNEMARASGIRHPTLHKRLPDLEKAGWVRKCVKRNCKITGELCWTWCLTTAEERAGMARVA